MPVYARHTLQTTPHFNPVDVAGVNGVANALKQWRGFAVVADEVRQLAARTSKATEEIVGVVEKNQVLSDDVMREMFSTREKAEQGLELANQAGAVIVEIQEGAKQVVEAVERFANELQ